jgi:hypothetical protein
MTLTALAADGFQQHVSHSARPPQLHCPAPCRGVLQLRFLGGWRSPYTYSLRQKNSFAKSVSAISPLCSPAAKKLSKVLCSFAILFLFKYDLLER